MSNQKRKIKRRKGGPRYQGIKLAISEDGLNFKSLDNFLAEYGGVPCLITAPDGVVIAAYQFFDPRRELITLHDGTAITVYNHGMAISQSADGGKNWSQYSKIRLKGIQEKIGRFGGSPCDPAIVLLEDGKMRLYFTCGLKKFGACTLSATSTNYEVFEVEEGVRFRDEGKMVLDPAVIKIGDIWHYFAPIPRERGKSYHAVSQNGLNFTREDDIVLDISMLGNLSPVEDGYRFYDGRSAFSTDGYNWIQENVKMPGNDPGVTRLKDGTYLMAYTTPALRSDPFE